jgi:hypothetical protein
MVAPSYTHDRTESTGVPVFPYLLEESSERYRSICDQPSLELFTYPSGVVLQDKIWFMLEDKDQTTISTALKIETLLLKLDKNDVKIPDSLSVKEYLTRYIDMLELVECVCFLTRGCFPPTTELSLEVYRDPEVDDEHLSLYVRQRPYDKNLMTTLKAITATYLDELAFKSGWLSVTTDFRFPRYQHAV